MGHAGVLIGVLLVGLVLELPVSAQTVSPQTTTGAGGTSRPRIEFFPRLALKLSGEHLSGDDRRFVWDTQFGGEVDLVDYGTGRATFRANYQAMLGEELRRFDPNQGNYELEGALSARARGYEVAGVFYHQSRHLSDRIKRAAIDWNMLGGRVAGAWKLGDGGAISARTDIRKTLLRSFVDYTWEADTRVRAEHPVAPRVGVFGAGGLRVLGVDGSRARGTQSGYRGEGGVQFKGGGGNLELFVAVERRVDPYQLQFSTVRWFMTGFRAVSR